MLKVLFAGLLGVVVILGAGPAMAHARLVAANPAKAAAVAPPPRISLTFSQRLEQKFSGLTLSNARGSAVKLKTSVGKDGLTLIAVPQSPLTPGAYLVKWHAVAGDAHRMEGSYSFTVR